VHLVEFFSGNAELSEITAPADGDDDPQCPNLFTAVQFQFQDLSGSTDIQNPPLGDLHIGGLTLQVFQQRFLDVMVELQVAVGSHLLRVGEDRFPGREVGHGLEFSFRFENHMVQTGLARFQRPLPAPPPCRRHRPR